MCESGRGGGVEKMGGHGSMGVGVAICTEALFETSLSRFLKPLLSLPHALPSPSRTPSPSLTSSPSLTHSPSLALSSQSIAPASSTRRRAHRKTRDLPPFLTQLCFHLPPVRSAPPTRVDGPTWLERMLEPHGCSSLVASLT